MQPKNWLYLAVMGLLGGTSLLALVWAQQTFPPIHPIVLLAVGALNAYSTTIVTRVPIDQRRGLHIGISDAPFIFTILAIGPAAILPIIVCDVIAHRLTRPYSGWIDALVNELYTCMIFVVTLAWFRVFGFWGAFSQGLALVSFALLYPAWEAVTGALAVKMLERRDVKPTGRFEIALSPTAWLTSITVALGGVAGLIYPAYPWLVPALALPVILAHYAIRAIARWLDVRIQAATLAEELAQTNQELAVLNAQLEERVAERTADVSALLDVRTRLAAELAHDLKHRFDVIDNAAHWLQTDVGSGASNGGQRRGWGVLHEASSAGKGLINELLDTSMLDQNQLELAPEAVDLIALAYDVVAQLQVDAQFQKCEIVFNAPPVLPSGWCDPARIERVVFNLVDNAIRYSVEYAQQHGSDARVTVTLEERPDSIHVAVRDTGPGIASQDVERLGRWGTRLSNRPHTGTGLGLAFCVRILTLSGGSLQIVSHGQGAGSTFIAAVPRCSATNQAAPVSDQAESMLT